MRLNLFLRFSQRSFVFVENERASASLRKVTSFSSVIRVTWYFWLNSASCC